MAKNYYLINNGRIRRDNNTLTIESADGQKRPIPVEDVDTLYFYGEVDLNTRLLNFLSQKKIVAHVFNYYGFYSGSYYPREYLNSGYLLVRQVRHYEDPAQRLFLAQELVRGAAHSLVRNLAYYSKRKEGGAQEERDPEGEIGGDAPPASNTPPDAVTEAIIDASASLPSFEPIPAEMEPDPFERLVEIGGAQEPLTELRDVVARLAKLVSEQKEVNMVRGIEGKMRERYYEAWTHILSGSWEFNLRVRRPPDNEVNALISFGNSHLYTVCLSEIYRTQLTPTISYLHEPGIRRFSLALDLSEIFKPLIVDRAIFRLLNTNQMKPEHFDRAMNGCYLTDSGKKVFLAALEARLSTTIHHRRLGRHVTYRHLIRLECYKLIRHLTEVETYKAFRAWW
ncbi:MAG: CRISPR-associated endonuclease Cas1 [Armatimonadetes bacterium]|nr:CRISPR-associated endonuclease Cas1 [Armatimonadota bacterium]